MVFDPKQPAAADGRRRNQGELPNGEPIDLGKSWLVMAHGYAVGCKRSLHV